MDDLLIYWKVETMIDRSLNEHYFLFLFDFRKCTNNMLERRKYTPHITTQEFSNFRFFLYNSTGDR